MSLQFAEAEASAPRHANSRVAQAGLHAGERKMKKEMQGESYCVWSRDEVDRQSATGEC